MRKFSRDSSGAVAMMFGLTVFFLIATTGAAIDFATVYSLRSHLQAAADAAAIAAARSDLGDQVAMKDAALRVFQADFPDASSYNLKLATSGDRISVEASGWQPMRLLQVVGLKQVKIEALSEVALPKNIDVEVVLVLDYSDSMNTNDKYIRLNEAAQALIDDITQNGQSTNVKIGVVPFAALVRVDLPTAFERTDRVYNGCTQDRRAPYNSQEAAGLDGDPSKWGEIASSHPCAAMDAAGLKVVPLSRNVADVKAKVAAMRPYVWTHIAVGVDLGWQLISPMGPFADAKPYDPKKVYKVFVLMTDGEQTAPGWGADGTRTVAAAEANTQALCSGMKNLGIQVFTIGYDLYSQHSLDQLKSCASPSKFFDAKDINSGLTTTFKAIGSDIKATLVRLSR